MPVPHGVDMSFHDNASMCPRCFSKARVLEGTFNIWGDTIHILRGTKATAAQLARLEEVLRNAQEKQQSPEKVAAEVERAGFGELAKRLVSSSRYPLGPNDPVGCALHGLRDPIIFQLRNYRVRLE